MGKEERKEKICLLRFKSRPLLQRFTLTAEAKMTRRLVTLSCVYLSNEHDHSYGEYKSYLLGFLSIIVVYLTI